MVNAYYAYLLPPPPPSLSLGTYFRLRVSDTLGRPGARSAALHSVRLLPPSKDNLRDGRRSIRIGGVRPFAAYRSAHAIRVLQDPRQ